MVEVYGYVMYMDFKIELCMYGTACVHLEDEDKDLKDKERNI